MSTKRKFEEIKSLVTSLYDLVDSEIEEAKDDGYSLVYESWHKDTCLIPNSELNKKIQDNKQLENHSMRDLLEIYMVDMNGDPESPLLSWQGQKFTFQHKDPKIKSKMSKTKESAEFYRAVVDQIHDYLDSADIKKYFTDYLGVPEHVRITDTYIFSIVI